MNAYESFAVGEYLGEIPDGKTYAEIKQMLLSKDDAVYVSQTYEYHSRQDIVWMMDWLRDELEVHFIPRN
jgi:hypothetical protein